MTDREKVIKATDICLGYGKCSDCGYHASEGCDGRMLYDVLDLLKEQEPLTVHDPGAICPNCKWPLYPEDHPNYCGNCGRAVKWDD